MSIKLDFFIIIRAEMKNGSLEEKERQGIMDFPIPVRCFTCNLPIAGKWKKFLELVKAKRIEKKQPELQYLTQTTTYTAEGEAMNELGLTRECCRRHFLTHPGL